MPRWPCYNRKCELKEECRTYSPAPAPDYDRTLTVGDFTLRVLGDFVIEGTQYALKACPQFEAQENES